MLTPDETTKRAAIIRPAKLRNNIVTTAFLLSFLAADLVVSTIGVFFFAKK